MNYNLIIDELNSWQKDEQLFRDFYNTTEQCLSLDDFKSKYADDPTNLSFALHPETINTFRHEDEFISKGQNIVVIKHPRYLPVFSHEHAFFEIIYVLSGQCVQHFVEKDVSLVKGDLCLLAPNVPHGIEVTSDSIVMNILIRRSTFMDIFINTIRDKSQISQFFIDNIYAQKKPRYLLFHTKSDELIRNYILDIYTEQLHLDEYSDRIACSILTIFFTQLIRRHKRDSEKPTVFNKNDDHANKIINYIVTHYDDISVEELANHFHYSRQYCSKLIKEFTGYTFSELLTNIRLQQGINLLLYTSMSIADISFKVGYQNPETFIRMFKKHEGITPSQYRRQQQ